MEIPIEAAITAGASLVATAAAAGTKIGTAASAYMQKRDADLEAAQNARATEAKAAAATVERLMDAQVIRIEKASAQSASATEAMHGVADNLKDVAAEVRRTGDATTLLAGKLDELLERLDILAKRLDALEKKGGSS